MTVVAGAGATFTGWSGACSGVAAICTTTMTAFRSVTAGFTTTFGGSFVDDPLVARSTTIKAVHLTELRLAIDRARARRSLPPFAWTDPVIVPRVTAVRALHVTQMRTALAAGPVRAAHIAELRAAVLALP